MASQRAALARQTTRSAAEKKAISEQAVIMALQRKEQAEAATKTVAKAKPLEVAAVEEAARTKAMEEEAIEAAAREKSLAEVPKKLSRKEVTDARRVARAAITAEAAQRLEEEQIAKDAAYVQAMEDNNASHLIHNPFSLPDNAKDWLIELVQYLPDEALGGEWRGCIKAFVTLNVDMNCEDMVSRGQNCINGSMLT